MATATFGNLMTGQNWDDQRARRRAFIRTNHPDVGGDPEAFARGLAEFDRATPRPESPRPESRMRVHRSRRPDRIVRGAVRDLRRRMNGTPPRRLE